MAGYSGTPLSRKLGIGAGHTVHVAHEPEGYRALLAPLPDGIVFSPRLSAATDLVHLFVTVRSALIKTLPAMRRTMRPDAVLWVSWPKKASKVATDVTEDVVREIALPLGLVDVKVCAVNDVWSGLKLVVRKELRRPEREPRRASAPATSDRPRTTRRAGPA
jgi:hypothetical protein